MLSMFASQSRILASCLLGGKLLLQRAVTLNLAWDDKLLDDIMSDWKASAKSMEKIVDCFSIPCYYCFGNEKLIKTLANRSSISFIAFAML